MAGKSRWYEHLPPATALVDCGGERHRVTWSRGKIKLEDHDLAAERAMVMLGAPPCTCLTALELWRNLFSWAMSAEMFREMDSRLGAGSNLLAPGDLRPLHEMALLLTWQRTWRRSSYFTDHERLLREQLRKRALPLLKEHVAVWRERAGSRLMSAVDVRVARPPQPSRLEGSLDRVKATAVAVLEPFWVLRVWARGFAVVGDAFVLDVVEDVSGSDEEVLVRAALWREQPPGSGRHEPAPGVARLRRDGDGQWHLSWEDAAPQRAPAPAPSLDELLERWRVGRGGGPYRAL